jgi:hypothetical protein
MAALFSPWNKGVSARHNALARVTTYLGQVDGLNVAKVRLEPEHLAVHETDQVLLRERGGEHTHTRGSVWRKNLEFLGIRLFQLVLQLFAFVAHQKVLLLLRLGLANVLDQLEEVTRQRFA